MILDNKNNFNEKITDNPLLVLKNINKSFGSIHALKGVNLRAFKGKAMGILGENGAGKSTLMNILSGVVQKTSGELYWNGSLRNNLKSVKDAEQMGVSIIHQEINCFNDMSVIDNLFAGHEKSKFGLIDYKSQKKLAKSVFSSLNLNIDLNEVMNKLTIAEQQMVEIAKSILRRSKLIIFDEPTSSLSKTEVEALFKTIKDLKNDGVAICYISHKLEEIPIVCDFITIIRDGNYIGEFIIGELNEDQLISKMVGREIIEKYPSKSNKNFERIIFKVENLSNNFVKNINFELYEGEILGFSGLIGSQRTELFKSIIGLIPKNSGKVFLKNKEIILRSVSSSIKKGIYYVTEDRKNDGLLLYDSIRKNISLSMLLKISTFGFISNKKEKVLAKSFINKMSIKTTSSENIVGSMSGGNQQKVLLARAFAAKPKIMIFDEPSRGVDVGSRREIYDLIYKAKDSGIGVIIISSDLPEIIGLCNRVIVMKKGRITSNLTQKSVNPEEIMKFSI
ncbi:sugar ABC transporter ATP-binding protein [Spiroplasma turonicum]|uniref:Ribose ABC transport ATP-binding protein n=1 Tax=Spiroplasma turonicum TaxID=216946 RepID=A0A0K1P7T6_9MOLU|nr:sugar ABC transporter ATP-binding protein [Spiroplasma turonicum]AKU79947.1 Ribose ABC transport ATP-binding protein [Spiroplasma turonicum]ALX70960.1 ribose ABC transporter ATP-binding protein [Spiroplasma turonicum]